LGGKIAHWARLEKRKKKIRAHLKIDRSPDATWQSKVLDEKGGGLGGGGSRSRKLLNEEKTWLKTCAK